MKASCGPLNPHTQPPDGLESSSTDDLATTTQNKPVVIDVLSNDIDPDRVFPNNSLVIVSGPLSGTASQNPATGLVTYRPTADFVGVDTFTYNVTDIEGKPPIASP